MRLQENMFQMKEQDKTPEEQLSKVNIGNQPWKEFKATMVKMIHNLRKWMEAQTERIQEMFIFLEGLVLYFKKTFINFQYQNSYTIGFFFPSWSPKRLHQRREHFKPIKLQDAPLTDLTETSSKKGDWVGKETLKDQHTAGPQTVESSHRQRGDQCASTPKKQRSKII